MEWDPAVSTDSGPVGEHTGERGLLAVGASREDEDESLAFVRNREGSLERELGSTASPRTSSPDTDAARHAGSGQLGLIGTGRAGPDHHGVASPSDTGAPTAMMNVRIDDVDAHHRRATDEAPRCSKSPKTCCGVTGVYEALDLEGHRWDFAHRCPSRLTP